MAVLCYESVLPSRAGSYRATINGAGAIATFDNRTMGCTDEGHLGDILQATTYLSGPAWG
ncbi:hypothetical protein FOXG_22868 [Fusarium oxysporum f. sp. lycopersici 4287]|uniref:Lysophospholipase n=1 Tax=Fusarium oxysporum f. sp. lycopersici (strain 4287 / CBS 123668 / FGSC 9935 / NRRL 34936) TaxID=426428 RepID=A0A0J9WCG6_FUSO4|nr:uncharacterized protein FOXG_22868 [Fusarium oxysporum f. sp. lycopersici 4287]KAJ9419576.1 hypothetical protein QL093DRAFT_2369772 [Fusarium oxysporum]KNB20563.1 hypothetical protein FOXG_22868 [Fusarium oxysporum f. sp. lycopersici 4287]